MQSAFPEFREIASLMSQVIYYDMWSGESVRIPVDLFDAFAYDPGR